MKRLSASGLADLAGTTAAEVERLVELGILVARDGAGPFLATDVRRSAWRWHAGRPGCRWTRSRRRSGRAGCRSPSWRPPRTADGRCARPGPTARSARTPGYPWSCSAAPLEAMGFARMAPDELIREDELEIVPLLGLGLSTGILDLAWLTRIGRAYSEGLRLAANVENEAYRARFTGPVRASGADQRTAMELASQLATDFLPLVDRALMGIYRRQQELVWTEDLVEDIENELERAGVLGRPERLPRCRSWTWWATPASPRSAATRRPPRWPSPWRCWSAGPRASTAGCR